MATSFWDGPPRISGNWSNWPLSTGVNFSLALISTPLLLAEIEERARAYI